MACRTAVRPSVQSALGKPNDRRPFCHALRRLLAGACVVLERVMTFLNWFTGTAGYTAILAAFGLAVADAIADVVHEELT